MSTEILLHNLSHADLVLTVSFPSSVSGNSDDQMTYVARPRFSEYNLVSERLYRLVKLGLDRLQLDRCALESRANDVPPALGEAATGFVVRGQGLRLDVSKLRFREPLPEVDGEPCKTCVVDGVYFPLLATLVPKWMSNLTLKEAVRRVVVLVSGRGKPLDDTAQEADNSTEFTAKLAALFLRQALPVLDLELLHSNTNLFRYDENIVFVKRELLPCVNRYRDALVTLFKGKWKEHMRVTLSFADGTSARVNAINASLRHFRPAYMHFWVVKSFWRERKIYEDDVECHSYEEVATEPAIPSDEAEDPLVRQVVQEMDLFRGEVLTLLSNPKSEHDLNSFWLRKTKKPVLAVLLVEKHGRTKLYRGTNMEVSMPTGSLCAERNVIGSALADDLTLLREDIKVIAVYSVNMSAATKGADSTKTERSESICSPEVQPLASPPNLCMPCEVMSPTVPKSPVVGHKRKIMHFNSEQDGVASASTTSSSSSVGVTSAASITVHTVLQENVMPAEPRALSQPTTTPLLPRTTAARTTRSGSKVESLLGGVESSSTKRSRSSKIKNIPFASPTSHSNLCSLDVDGSAQPAPRIVPTMTTIHVDESDMNPLKPCGACNEWLKKIAEVNPHLKVITFTDADCKGIYVEQIAD